MIKIKSKGVPREPRYELIKKLVTYTLLTHCSYEIPISLEHIVDQFDDLNLKSYEWYQKTMNVSLEYVINSVAKSKDGSLIDISDGTGFTSKMILYENREQPGRKRFTVAHELGHYLLRHNELTSNMIMSRNSFDEPEYKVLEKEANFFARMLLVPLPLLYDVAKDWGPISKRNVKDLFNVTFEAAGNVINHINKMQNLGFLPSNRDIVKKYTRRLDRFINIHLCNICNAEFISNKPNHCPICGNTKLVRVMSKEYEVFNEFERSDYMIYDGIEVDKDSRAIRCPICDNEELEVGGYCSICGGYIVNRCTNVDHYNRSEYDGPICGELLEGNARYCTHCGAESTFLQNDILATWEHVIDMEKTLSFATDDIPF